MPNKYLNDDLFEQGVWVDTTGKHWHVSELTEKHLLNIASHLTFEAHVACDKVKQLADDWDVTYLDFLNEHPFWGQITAECAQRGITKKLRKIYLGVKT